MLFLSFIFLTICSAAAAPLLLNPQDTLTNITTTTQKSPNGFQICNKRPPRANVAKKGVAYDQANTQWANQFSASWAYNWHSNQHYYFSSPNLKPQMEYVPMMWGLKADLIRDWNGNVERHLKGNDRAHLLAFNEPDHNGESNMGPGDAAAQYRVFMHPFNCKARLGAPSVTSTRDDRGKGLGWLDQFLGVCGDCVIDFFPIHIYVYSPYPDPVGFLRDQVVKTEETLGRHRRDKLIWITEFEFVGFGEEKEANLMEDAMRWLNGRASVERYAYYKAGKNFLINPAGTGLSRLGSTYNRI